MTGAAPLLGVIVLIGLGGLFAAVDAAISTVSVARVHELVRDERPGAVRRWDGGVAGSGGGGVSARSVKSSDRC